MSLDGFVADPQGNAARLYPDLGDLGGTDYMNEAIAQTGAVIMGRRTFEMADPDSYVGNYEFQVPIFVVTHHPPATAPKQDEHLTSPSSRTASSPRPARRIDVMPVVLGAGLRLLENVDPDRVRLEKLSVEEVGARTSLGFRVVS